LWGFTVIILLPILHEFIFRGITLYRALRVFPPAAAIIIQAILYALVTISLFHGIFVFVLGLVLGFVYWKAESIWASFAVNAAYALALILGYIVFLF